MLPGIGALHVWHRNWQSWKGYALSFVVAALGGPIFYLVAIGYGLGRFVADIDGIPYAVFLVPGILASAAMNTATFETTFGSYTRLAEQNTYLAILATPCSVADIVGGDVLFAATKSVFSVTIVLGVTVAWGLVPSPLAIACIPVAFLMGLLFGALGMVVTARASSYQFFDYYFTLGLSVMLFFSGVFFPLGSLPGWAQAAAWLMPLSHGVAICRALVSGTPTMGLLGDVMWMLVVTAGVFAVAERLVRRRLVV
ncbi:MAG TPA: ABC transporter permease [Candidatus Binatia bacterium]|jgi:lipooligosaccharide transport system permease protein|nr:ABC transporter permease [Candidatus Binatia bacterium]